MIDWLKPILGNGYNEEIDNKIAAEINKDFVAKADYDAAKDAQRTAAEALADANKALAEYKDTDIDGLRKSAEEWQAKAEQAEKDAARPSVLCSIWTPCAAAKTPTRTFPPHWPRCRRTAAICSTPRKLRRPMLQARAAPP